MIKKVINPAFGLKLAELRVAKGLTQDALAEQSGVPRGTIREFEQGKREPLFSNMLKLGRCLGVSLESFPSPVLDS